MCILEKLNFKISRGSMSLDPLVYSRLCARSYFCLTNSELLLPGLLLPMGNITFSILITQKDVSFFSVEKGAPSVLYRDIYFKDCWHEVRSSLKCTPRRKSCVRACSTRHDQRTNKHRGWQGQFSIVYRVVHAFFFYKNQ